MLPEALANAEPLEPEYHSTPAPTLDWFHPPSVQAHLSTLTPEQQLQELADVLAKHPNHGFILGHYGKACLANHDHEQAVTHLTQALETQINDASLSFSLGRVYLELGEGSKALTALQQAVKIAGNPDHTMLLIRTATDLNELHAALMACKAGLNNHPNDPRFPCVYAKTLAMDGKPELALQWIDANDKHTTVELAEARHSIYQQMGNNTLAELAYREYQRRLLCSQSDYRQQALKVVSKLPSSTLKQNLIEQWNTSLLEFIQPHDEKKQEDSRESALPTLAMSILVRDEVDIIAENIAYHAAMGVSHFVVTDNGSIDGTREKLSELSKHYSIDIIDEPSHTIDQDLWVTRMGQRVAAANQHDWIIHNDADEFWVPANGQSLPEAILQCITARSSQPENIGVLSCRRFNLLTNEADAEDPNYRFYDNVHAVVKNVPLSEGQEKWANHDMNTVARHVLDKVMTRTQGLTEVGYGNHGATHELDKTDCGTVSIYHYPVRTYAQFQKKVVNYGKSLEKNTRFGQGSSMHLRYWYQRYLDGKLEQDYEAISFSQTELDNFVQQGYAREDDTLVQFFKTAPVHWG